MRCALHVRYWLAPRAMTSKVLSKQRSTNDKVTVVRKLFADSARAETVTVVVYCCGGRALNGGYGRGSMQSCVILDGSFCA